MLEHVNHYSKEENPAAKFSYGDLTTVDLFPYKIKSREKFYHRDHPTGIAPEEIAYEIYWENFLEKCIEGIWVNDGKVWVYMPPKLFYYVNYVLIRDKYRRTVHPTLHDIEWIYGYYNLVVDGFSGFELDDKYSCNDKISKIDENTSEILLRQIPKSCYNKDGNLKIYVDPWTYLTRTYLIDEPRGNLGHPLYENEPKNYLVLGGRGLHKTFYWFIGDFMHEFSFSGVKRIEYLDNVNDGFNFAMGAGRDDQLQRSINNIKSFYDNQPGKYNYGEDERGKPQVWMGPFYKNYQGGFKVGGVFQHIIKEGDKIELFGSTVQMGVLTPDRKNIATGDRFRRILIEEVGFIDFIKDSFDLTRESISVHGEKVGTWGGIGTSGDMVSIKASKEMMDKPEAFGMATTPNYYKNLNRNIALFLPSIYQKRVCEDENGFIYVDEALKMISEERESWSKDLDSTSYAIRVMSNPINPDEMLVPTGTSILPKQEAQNRLAEIESYDIFKKMANVGTVVYDREAEYGVKFRKDHSGKLTPILQYNVDSQKTDIRGAAVMYEPPPVGRIPENMYWGIYDPAAKSGAGPSYHSLIIYKHFLAKDGKNMKDNIPFEWIGREEKLYDNYENVIRTAKLYNAKIFPETNVTGFVEWCRQNKHHGMLQSDNHALEKEIYPNARRSYHRVGFNMKNQRIKWWALQRLADWLTEVKVWDEKTNIPLYRNIDFIYSQRLLEEIVHHNYSDNFDHISSMLGLMILLNQIESVEPRDVEEPEWEDGYVPKYRRDRRKTRAQIENY